MAAGGKMGMIVKRSKQFMPLLMRVLISSILLMFIATGSVKMLWPGP